MYSLGTLARVPVANFRRTLPKFAGDRRFKSISGQGKSMKINCSNEWVIKVMRERRRLNYGSSKVKEEIISLY